MRRKILHRTIHPAGMYKSAPFHSERIMQHPYKWEFSDSAILLDNIASQAVAIANGGVVTERTDERVFIWIDTK